MVEHHFIVASYDVRQAATQLAALRFWQRMTARQRGRNSEIPEVELATNGGKLRALNNVEIDELAEQIKIGPLDVKPPAEPSKRPNCIWVVVHGSSYTPEAFGSEKLAEDFIAGRTDALSGPWAIYVGG